jgi:hypothetical protein
LCILVLGLTAARRERPAVLKKPAEQIALKDLATGALVAPLSQGGTLELRAVADAGGPPVPTIAVTPELLAQKPELRFVAWQSDWQGQELAGHPDGTAVAEPAELALLRVSRPTSCDASASTSGGTNPRFLHLWLSHPLFDRQSLVSIRLIGEDGTPIELGAGGMMAHNSHVADEHSGDLGWITATLSPGDGAPPARVGLQLEYALGPLQDARAVAPDFRGGMGLEGNSQLSAIGSDSAGKSFVALSVNTHDLGARQFGVVALTKDGREIAQSGGGSSGPVGGALLSQRFDFDLPLNQVEQFKIGTRPVRTAEWSQIVLPATAR